MITHIELDTARELSYGIKVDGYEHVATEEGDNRRWSRMNNVVFSYENELYAFEYDEGLTEHQEDDYYEDLDGNVEVYLVEAYTYATTGYRKVVSD